MLCPQDLWCQPSRWGELEDGHTWGVSVGRQTPVSGFRHPAIYPTMPLLEPVRIMDECAWAIGPPMTHLDDEREAGKGREQPEMGLLVVISQSSCGPPPPPDR